MDQQRELLPEGRERVSSMVKHADGYLKAYARRHAGIMFGRAIVRSMIFKVPLDACFGMMPVAQAASRSSPIALAARPMGRRGKISCAGPMKRAVPPGSVAISSALWRRLRPRQHSRRNVQPRQLI